MQRYPQDRKSGSQKPRILKKIITYRAIIDSSRYSHFFVVPIMIVKSLRHGREYCSKQGIKFNVYEVLFHYVKDARRRSQKFIFECNRCKFYDCENMPTHFTANCVCIIIAIWLIGEWLYWSSFSVATGCQCVKLTMRIFQLNLSLHRDKTTFLLD